MNQDIIFYAQLGVLITVFIAGYIFIRVLMKSYYQRGYLQGRLDEYEYQQEEHNKFIKMLFDGAYIRREELDKINKQTKKKGYSVVESTLSDKVSEKFKDDNKTYN